MAAYMFVWWIVPQAPRIFAAPRVLLASPRLAGNQGI